MGEQGFAQSSNLTMLTIEYDAGQLAIGAQAFKKLDLAILMECETGCGTCLGPNECDCATRPLVLGPDSFKQAAVHIEAVCAPVAPPPPSEFDSPSQSPPPPPAEACLTLSANVGKNEFKEASVKGTCATISAGSTSVGKQGFAQSDLATLTIKYDATQLEIGEQAFKKLVLTIYMECETGCGDDTCPGPNDCGCATRPLTLTLDSFQQACV